MGQVPTQINFDEGEKCGAEVQASARMKFPSIRFCPEDLAHDGPIVRGWFSQRTPQEDLIVSAGRRTHLYDLHHDYTVPPMLYFGLMIDGLMHNRVGHQNFDVTSGTFLAAAASEPQHLHTLHPGGRNIDIVSIQVHTGWLNTHFPDEDMPLRRLASHALTMCTGKADPGMLMAGRRMQDLIREDSLSGRLRFEAATLDFVAMMTDLLSGGQSGAARSLTATTALPPGGARRMADLRARLDAVAPGEEITLASLAAEFGMSASSLSRQFRAAFDTTIMQYLARHRLEMARNALARDEMSVAQAAWLAGFSGPANFTTAFKRAFGITPAQIRHLKSLS